MMGSFSSWPMRHHLSAVTWVMIACGGLVGFLFGKDHYLPAGTSPGPEN